MNLDKEIQDKINDSFRAMHRKTDAYIIEQLFSLISNGVIELTQTQMETKRLEDLDTNSLKLSTSKCVGLSFKGKEKIIELEAKNKQLKEENESHLAMINMLEIRSGELIQESKQQEKLLIEALNIVKIENQKTGSFQCLEFLEGKNKSEIKELLERKGNNN
jgi:hypothetical protein